MRKITLLMFVFSVLIFPLGVNLETAQAEDVYSSFTQLRKHQTAGKDYRITSYNGASRTAVIAIHGGRIEIHTSQLAKTVANMTGSDLYTFEGIKARRNGALHVTSTRFNEPRARQLVANSNKTLSIHGCKGKQAVTYVGGQDSELRRKVTASLREAGFRVVNPPGRLDGKASRNICNLNAIGEGVQVELTLPLRKKMYSGGEPNKLFYNYAAALSKAIK